MVRTRDDDVRTLGEPLTGSPRTETTGVVPRYRNPIIDNDWPDPDAIRVGNDYYLIASSFNRAPGLPILHSTDLVEWTRVGHALEVNDPADWYALPRHGAGVWAPSIRHHDGVFQIVYPDPERGILVVSATDAAGPWSAPRTLLPGLGLIDPCPLWDDDGAAYLVHGWAKSRSGRKNVLTVVPVDAGLTRAVGPAVDVVDGAQLPGCTTLEGPKFYRREGWYWIFAPAGGVADGWQSVFRSRSPYGPYEHRIVLEQGDSPVNGPHQGAWVDAVDGSHWFLHFQDRGVFGRVLHLQPMAWGEDGWPVMGTAALREDEGEGEEPGRPVATAPAPLGGTQGSRTTTTSDSFAGGVGQQWSWQATPQPDWAVAETGGLALRGLADDAGNLRTLPHVLGQPLPGMPSRSTVSIALEGPDDSRAGIAVLGRDYLWAGVRRGADGPRLVVATRTDGDLAETIAVDEPLSSGAATLTLHVDARAAVRVALGDRTLHEGFTAVAGHWIGAEIALFAAAPYGGREARALVGPFAVQVDEGDAARG